MFDKALVEVPLLITGMPGVDALHPDKGNECKLSEAHYAELSGNKNMAMRQLGQGKG